MRSPEPYLAREAPLTPLLAKELAEIVCGRALWTMLLLVCPLIGYSFVQAVSLYGEASASARQSPVLAASLSPLDGVLVPTFGAFYVAVTLLFPFVAIRVLGQEKESGALRLLIQLPYRSSTLILAKLAAVLAAWILASIPALSALAIWAMMGGHLAASETVNLLFGHLLYGLLVGAIALFAATIADSSATSAIIALAVTIGSWVLDFTLAGHSGVAAFVAQLSLTQALRPFEQGLFSAGPVLGIIGAIAGLSALASVWLPPGTPTQTKCMRSVPCVLAVLLALGMTTQIKQSVDVTQDRRNSFPAADQRLLATLRLPLVIKVNLAPEDPRYADLQRNVLAKLDRAMPNVSIIVIGSHRDAAGQPANDAYGEIEYSYGARSDVSRSTSPREVLPLLYALAGMQPPASAPGDEYPGYPLVATADAALFWFVGGLPLLIAGAWWWSRRPPAKSPFTCRGAQS
ncbi:ABC transporter permease subunit [Bradyrhizobium sp. Ai1a-2]|uniref:ABC transporter permease subunit n=1 Tax=Bradyrhizobium sp. Ai1a-2 TaxID=196490 RepID=UPI0005BE5F34|nr:ABC transporter permease subunit [Bradyrhizobium sp. Ai1a-2]